MVDMDTRYLAALVCVYSLFEFLIKRVYLSHSHLQVTNFRRAASQAGILFLFMSVGTSGFLSVKLVVGYVVIAVIYLIHELMSGKRVKPEFKWTLEWFLLKQLVFGILLLLLWRNTLPIALHRWYVGVESYMLSGLGTFADALRGNCTMILATVSAYLFVIDGGTRIVRGVFNKFPKLYANVLKKLNEDTGNEKEENVGEWIGVLERVITLTFVLTGSFTALAFALTAKSIARFKELDDKEFSEYYILGTSSSLIIALFSGMMIKIVFGL